MMPQWGDYLGKSFMLRTKLHDILVVLMLLTTGSANALGVVDTSNLPEYYPSSFDVTGTVQAIDQRNAHILLSAVRYDYLNTTKYAKLKTKFSWMGQLRVGTNVGLVVGGKNEQGYTVLLEVYELPSDLDLGH